MGQNYGDYSEKAQDARRALERERDELMKRAEELDANLRVLDKLDDVLSENRRLRGDMEELEQQLDQ